MLRNLCAAQVWCAVVVLVGATTPAQAYLGSFNTLLGDGYDVQSGFVYGDVSYYNAGQYGANAGGGPGPTQITADSGLWSVTGEVGGYFDNSTDRGNYTLGFPPYPAANPGNQIGAYIVGGHFGGRTDNYALALRNDQGSGPMTYDYLLDSFDFGGVAPASITTGVVEVGFYFCPNPGDAASISGLNDKFTMTFKDSSGNVGFQFGYDRDNLVTYRANPSTAWISTTITADQNFYDGVRFDIDLTNETFSFDYFDFTASSWTNIVTGAAMYQAMDDLSVLGWQLEDGILAGNLLGKNLFDDFSFGEPVPEPTSLALIALVGAIAVGFRRR